jgi:hypothetical protein
MSQFNGNFYETKAKNDYLNNNKITTPQARDPFFEGFGQTEHFAPNAQEASLEGTGNDELLVEDVNLGLNNNDVQDTEKVAEAASDAINDVADVVEENKESTEILEAQVKEQQEQIQALADKIEDSEAVRPAAKDDGDAGTLDRIINSLYILMGFDNDKPTYMPVREFGDSMRGIITLLGLLFVVYAFAQVFNMGHSVPSKKEIKVTKLDWDTTKDYGTDAVGYGTKDGLSSSAHLF